MNFSSHFVQFFCSFFELFGSKMSVNIKGGLNIGVSEDVLRGLWVNAFFKKHRSVCVAEHMRGDFGQIVFLLVFSP